MICRDGEVMFNKTILSMAVAMLTEDIWSSASSEESTVRILLPDYGVQTVQVRLFKLFMI
jgi:hypothetical protein